MKKILFSLTDCKSLHAQALEESAEGALVAVHGRIKRYQEEFAWQGDISSHTAHEDVMQHGHMNAEFIVTLHPMKHAHLMEVFAARCHFPVKKPVLMGRYGVYKNGSGSRENWSSSISL